MLRSMYGVGSDPPTDAVVRVVLACVCGSDLWWYRGISDLPHGSVGHEFIGVVDEIGSEVTELAVGDFVISPFSWSDGTCRNCQAGFHTACVHGGFFGQGGDGDGGNTMREHDHVFHPRAKLLRNMTRKGVYIFDQVAKTHCRAANSRGVSMPSRWNSRAESVHCQSKRSGK